MHRSLVPRTVARPAIVAMLSWLTTVGCVGYHPDATTLSSVAADVDARRGRALDWESAVAHVFEHDPTLAALEAELRGARAAAQQPLLFRGEWRSGMDTLSLMVDPIALLGLGPRGGAIDAAEAEAATAAAALAEA